MAKYFGKIGFGVPKEIRPGVWKNAIIELEYYGDVVQDYRKMQNSENLNDNVTLNNKFSIISDPFALTNISNILYIEYLGTKWKVNTVEIQYPRLTLWIGGVWNGETGPGTRETSN